MVWRTVLRLPTGSTTEGARAALLLGACLFVLGALAVSCSLCTRSSVEVISSS